MPPMSVTLDTSQDPIGPCEPWEQSLDSLRNSPIAAFSSALDFGLKTVAVLVPGHIFRGESVAEGDHVNAAVGKVSVSLRVRILVNVRARVMVS